MKGASLSWPLRPEFVWETLKILEEFADCVTDAKGSMLLYDAYDPAKTVQSAGT
jgi:hypothetical protein